MMALEQLIIPLFSFTLFIFFLHKWRFSSPRKNLPPSPKSLPIIGNLHQLGKIPHRSLRSLSDRYGQLFLLHFGRTPVLIASSCEAACEIMKKQDRIFSSRPKLGIVDQLLYNCRGVSSAPYGEYWRQIKSICVLQLLSTTRVQSYRRVREEETSIMVEKIRQSAGSSSSSVVDLSEIMASVTSNIICRVALGRTYDDHGDKGFKKLIGELAELLGAPSLADYIPWLGWIDRVNGKDAKVERVARHVDEFLENVIRDHRDERRKHDKDFVDILLEFQRESKNRSPVEDGAIKAIILDIFVGGTETTVSVLEWAIAELIRNPPAMKTLQNEVKEVVGTKSEIDEDNLKKMPYLKAVIKETLRLHPSVPLLVPRESTQDTKVMGYDVSTGTQVMINAWAIGRNPSSWENPENFHPERFLDSSVDFRGLHFEFVPFGAGRRGCPGIAFAVSVDELGLAKLVHNFNFGLPNGERGEDLDMSEASGISVHKKFPLILVTTSNTC